MAETTSEPRQPSRLEKKKNMPPPRWTSALDQRADQREQSLVLRSVALCTEEMPDLDQRRPSP